MLNKLKEFTEFLKKEIAEKTLDVKEANDIYAQMRKEFVQATYIVGEFAFASHFVELLRKVKEKVSFEHVDKITFSLCIGPHYNDEGYRVEVLTDYSYLKLYTGLTEVNTVAVNNVFFQWAENVNISSIGRILPSPPNVDSEQFIRVVIGEPQKLVKLLDKDTIKAHEVLETFTKLKIDVHG